ncbi:MAG: T9SS type B sorting domain-containing protein [Flavobacteriaceae bacterium]|nr:T9SS type B sorting domain-containing protein [Flavobacteriaceae bacterium]
MKKATCIHFFAFTISIITLFLHNTASAQVHTPFTPRYSEKVKGDVTIIANNMISRHATNAYNGNASNHNFNDNVYVDIDSDNTTFNSSSASFTNPDPSVPCITIFKAFLYWAAADKEQDNGDDNQPNWNYDDIKVMLPGETVYTTMTADDVIYRGRDTHTSNDPYVCFKDITTQVMALQDIYGTYQIANVEGKDGDLVDHDGSHPGTSGGWQIVFVYVSPDLPTKNITLFDGYAHVTNIINDVDVDFNGFLTIPSGPVNANVVIGSLEGDRSLNGDRLQIQDVTNNFVDIVAPFRNTDNFFNSRITIGNNNYIDRNPASINTLGFDAAVFQLDNPGNSIIANNQTSATLRLTSNSEIYGLFLLGLSVEVWAPDLHPSLLTHTSGTNPADPGDLLGFNINVLNAGNDDATNVSYSTVLPPQLTLSSVPNMPNGVNYTYDEPSRALSFDISDGFLNVNDPELNIEFELEINNACYFLEDNCDLSFDLQFDVSYNGVTNPDSQTTLSTSDINSCESLPLSVDINQPIVNWATNTGALDTTIECSDTSGLTAAQALEPVPDKCTFSLLKTSGSFIPDANCPGAGTYTNSWTFTDACGNTIDDFVQTITVIDSESPTGSNPPTLYYQCIDDIPANDVTVVTDAADNCSTPTVTYVSDVSDNQTCPETILRSYRITDACNNSTDVFQTIIINDDIPPTASNPPDININCIEELPVPDVTVVSDAADNCGDAVVSFVSDISDNQSCSETIVRSYKIEDTCGNDITVTQNIYIVDDSAPVLESDLEREIYVTCQEIPEIPDLEFSDNCDENLDIQYNEILNQVDDLNFDIQRSWTVTDVCNNQNVFTQSIYVNRTAESNTQYIDLCIEDDPLDVLALVPYNVTTNTNNLINEWNGDSVDLLTNGMLDPSNAQLGDYEFVNRITDNDCTWTTTIYISINDDCVYYPCIESTADVTISKMVTPNNDDFNDYFTVEYILNEDRNEVCDIVTKVQIFNRWGNKVFETNNYDNNWSGVTNSTSTTTSGYLPTATYYYIVELVNGGLKPIQGFIYLGTE